MKRCSIVLRTIVAATLAALLMPTTPLLAQKPQQQAVSDQRVKELMTQALAQVNAGQTPQGTVQRQQGPTVDLRIDEAVTRAMDQNIDLSVARLNPQIQDLALAQTRGLYRPTVSTTLGDLSRNSTSNSTIGGGNAGQTVNTQTYTYNGQLQQIFPWTGGTATLSFNNNRQLTDNNTVQINPTFTSTFQASIQQPLWKNFRIDANRNALWTGIISRQIADVNLRASVINTEASTRIAYWNLVYAVQNVEVTRQSLALAEKLVQDNQAKVEIGTLAPLDVIQAQAQAATARANLVTAEQTRTNNEISLKRLIVSSAQDPLWNATINPTDRPEPPTQVPPIDLEAAIRNALDQRTDLITARETLRSNEITLKYNKNQTLPDATLNAYYQGQGTGGNIYNIHDPARPLMSQGGYFDALSMMRTFQVPTWNVSVTLSYPIGTSQADAALARARVQYQQTQQQLKSAELQAATQVTQAALNVRSSLQQVETRRAARELAQKQLEAEQSKFDVGMSTNYNVVQMQNALLAAQVAELQAILSYRQNLVTFDQVQKTGNASVSGVSSTSTGSSSAGGSGGSGSGGSGSGGSGSSGGGAFTGGQGGPSGGQQ